MRTWLANAAFPSTPRAIGFLKTSFAVASLLTIGAGSALVNLRAKPLAARHR